MKLPLKLVFQKGRVLVIEMHFPQTNVTKSKYVVILNKDVTDPVLLILPTTQSGAYKTKYRHKNHFIVERGKSKCFTKENVFDFENIMEMTLRQFEQLYEKCLIETHDILEQDLLDKIDMHVRMSKTIEKYKKKIVLGEE